MSNFIHKYYEMTKDELKNRTKQFALQVIKLVDELPNTIAGRQLEIR